MNRIRPRPAAFPTVALAALVLSGATMAQELERATVAAGGETSAGGRFELVSLSGQPFVGRAEGDAYVLRVGALVPRPGAAGSLVFQDGFEDGIAAPRRKTPTEEPP